MAEDDAWQYVPPLDAPASPRLKLPDSAVAPLLVITIVLLALMPIIILAIVLFCAALW